MDTERLIKFLNLTSSDSDNEAMVALRMALKILKKENLTWEKLLSGGSTRVEYRVEYRDRIVYQDRVVEKIVYRDRPDDNWVPKDFKPKSPQEEPELDTRKPRADLKRTGAAFAKLAPEIHRMTPSTLKWYNTICSYYNERGYITVRYLEMLETFVRKMG